MSRADIGFFWGAAILAAVLVVVWAVPRALAWWRGYLDCRRRRHRGPNLDEAIKKLKVWGVVLALTLLSTAADATTHHSHGRTHHGKNRCLRSRHGHCTRSAGQRRSHHHVPKVRKMVASEQPSTPNCRHRQVGTASWYGPGPDCKGCPRGGHWTATGEYFTGQDFTAAHRTLPLGTVVKVCLGDGSRCVNATINDRGPAKWTGRIIDLSRRTATELGMMGVGPVEICWGD